MSLLQRAGHVSMALRNAGRVREIIGAMSRFGFGTVVEKIGLKKYIPGKTRKLWVDPLTKKPMPMEKRIRLLCEELGPTFIKIGQVLAGRPDLIPAELVQEFSKLQDKVSPIPFSDIKKVVEESLGREISQAFSSFDTEALATASIAQVHTARTLEGDEVVVKVRKPRVETLLRQDLEILEGLAALMAHYVEELKPFRPVSMLHEFKKSLLEEIDFNREANSMRRFRQNFEDSDFFVVPNVYRELSNDRILTMQRLRGVKLNNGEELRAQGVDTQTILRKGMEGFFKSILSDGFFHGDPHGGNILVLEDGRMGLLDFGSVGFLNRKSKDALVNMFISLVAEDYDSLVLEYLYLSPPHKNSRSSTNIDAIQREVSQHFSIYRGLPLKDIPAGKVLLDACNVAFRYRVSLPQDLILVFRAIMTLEGIGRSLDPNFDLLGAASKFTGRLLKERYAPDRILGDLFLFSRDLLRFSRNAPRQMGETLRQLESGEFQIHLKQDDVQEMSRSKTLAASKIAASLLSLGMMLSMTLLSIHSILPLWLETTLWIFTAVYGFFAGFLILKK